MNLQRQKVDQQLPGAKRRRGQEMTANEYGASYWGDESALKLNSDDFCTIL